MNHIPSPNPKRTATAPPNAAAPGASASPNLGATLREDYDAVLENLRQTNELAADLEKQLAGKSKEMLHLKFLFEQTKSNLTHLQDGIVALRKERHDLANDAMRARGLEIMLKRVTEERDRLKTELEGVLDGLALENSAKALKFDKRDHRIAELTFELMQVRQEVENLRRANHRPVTPPPPREMPLKTSAETFNTDALDDDGVDIIPTERVAGHRG